MPVGGGGAGAAAGARLATRARASNASRAGAPRRGTPDSRTDMGIVKTPGKFVAKTGGGSTSSRSGKFSRKA